jgi:hypothetical protein
MFDLEPRIVVAFNETRFHLERLAFWCRTTQCALLKKVSLLIAYRTRECRIRPLTLTPPVRKTVVHCLQLKLVGFWLNYDLVECMVENLTQ